MFRCMYLGLCLPGSHSENGIEPCSTCQIGYYQSHYSEIECDPCPSGTSTWRRGAHTSNECGGKIIYCFIGIILELYIDLN